MKKLLLILTAIFFQGCSVFGIRTVEMLDYTLIEKEGDFDIRQYQDYWVVRTEVEGQYKASQGPWPYAVLPALFFENIFCDIVTEIGNDNYVARAMKSRPIEGSLENPRGLKAGPVDYDHFGRQAAA